MTVRRAQRRGRSEALRGRLGSIATELASTRTIKDRAHAKLSETRNSVLAEWMGIAGVREAQGESALAPSVSASEADGRPAADSSETQFDPSELSYRSDDPKINAAFLYSQTRAKALNASNTPFDSTRWLKVAAIIAAASAIAWL